MLLPKVSIIIPAFNEEKFLPSCLNSINELNYPIEKIEVIVVDNGSTDTTREIAEMRNATVLVNDTMNVSGLRNLGAKHASGELLAFVDADCTVTPEWLNMAVSHFQDNSIVAWGAPANIPVEATWVQETWNIIRKKKTGIHDTDWLESMNLFIRRKDFLEIDGFDESLVTCEDVDICYRLKRLGRIISDSKIQIIHHGEAATLRHFFRKEVWRGMGNFQGLRIHGFSLNEMPSLLLPLYFIFLPPLSVFLTVSLANGFGVVLFFFLLIFPALGVIAKKKVWNLTPLTMVRLICLLELYFFARTVALFKKNKNR